MLQPNEQTPLSTLPVRDQVKTLINRITERVQETPMSIQEIEAAFLEWTRSEVDADFYFEACLTCFPKLSIYSSDALTLEQATSLLDDTQAFECLTIDLEFTSNTYTLNFAFDWEDPAQFKTVATTALTELSTQSTDGYIEDTLMSLSKALSWDESYSTQLCIKNLRLR